MKVHIEYQLRIQPYSNRSRILRYSAFKWWQFIFHKDLAYSTFNFERDNLYALHLLH